MSFNEHINCLTLNSGAIYNDGKKVTTFSDEEILEIINDMEEVVNGDIPLKKLNVSDSETYIFKQPSIKFTPFEIINPISCGTAFTAALLNTGKVVAFGLNNDGQLGNGNGGTDVSSNIPVDVSHNATYNGTNAISVSCGDKHSAILLKSGKILTFGSNNEGELGNGDNIDRLIPVDVSHNATYNGTNAVSIACGGNHTAALLNTGKVIAFGNNFYGQLGNGGIDASSNIPVDVSFNAGYVGSNAGYDGTNAVSISCGAYHTAILLKTGKVVTFGFNDNGQLGNGNGGIDASSNIPVDVSFNAGYDGTNAVSISCGAYHTAILLKTGKVVTFGFNDNGQLGNGIDASSNIPVDVSFTAGYDGTNAVKVACGQFHTALLLSSGKVVTFGNNFNGQLGDGSEVNKNIPVEMVIDNSYNKTNAIGIYVGGNHTAVLLNSGKILTCGSNSSGQLGNDNVGYTNRNTLGIVKDVDGIKQSIAIPQLNIIEQTLLHTNAKESDIIDINYNYDRITTINILNKFYLNLIIGPIDNLPSHFYNSLSNEYKFYSNDFNYLTMNSNVEKTNLIYNKLGDNNEQKILTFNNSGNFGIGTAFPNSQFEVSTPNDSELRLSRTLNSGGMTILRQRYGESQLVYYRTDGDLPGFKIKRNTDGNSEIDVMTFDGSGNVEIGTDDPSFNMFLVNGSGRFNSNLYFGSANDENYIVASPGNNTITINGKENIFLDGNVGIGTDEPGEYEDNKIRLTIYDKNSCNLEIRSNTKYAALGIFSGNTNDYSYINYNEKFSILKRNSGHQLRIESSGEVNIENNLRLLNQQYIYFGSDNFTSIAGGYPYSYLSFKTSGTERIRVDYLGNVGIGTNSPDSLLHLKSSVRPQLKVGHAVDSGYIAISDYNIVGYNTSKLEIYNDYSNLLLGGEHDVEINKNCFVYGNLNVNNIVANSSVSSVFEINTPSIIDMVYPNNITHQFQSDTIQLGNGGNSCSLTLHGSIVALGTNSANVFMGNVQFQERINVGHSSSSYNYPIHIGDQLIQKNITNATVAELILGMSTYTGSTQDEAIWQRWTTKTPEIGIRIDDGGILLISGNLFKSSDIRIKENIVDVPDNLSLQKLRDINCKYYEYKDKIRNGNEKTIGFIAQNVREHFPIAVSLEKGFIPNEMRPIKDFDWSPVLDTSGNNKIKLNIPDLEDISGNTKYKFYVFNDISGNDMVEKEINSLVDEPKSFLFDQSWNHIFLYGKEIDDFHVLDKQKLFALNFSATQEIDRIQQQQIVDIESLKSENDDLKTKITNLETQLESVLKRLSILENN